MTGFAQAENQVVPPATRVRGADRTQALAAIAIGVALLSLVVGFSKAGVADIQEVRAELSAVEGSALTQSDLSGLEAQIHGVEASLADAEAALANLDTLTDDMAAASKVEAAIQQLQLNIDALRRTVSSLCDQVNFSPITAPYPGSC